MKFKLFIGMCHMYLFVPFVQQPLEETIGEHQAAILAPNINESTKICSDHC